MKTLLTIAQQNEFIQNNFKVVQIEHKWSSRGYGNSKILDLHCTQIAKRGGCGYDRFGAVIGDYIESIFQDELNKLAKRFAKVKYSTGSKKSNEFYGLFINKDGKAYLDGVCGISCMRKVLNAIGFELKYLNETKNSVSGSQFYELVPVSAHIKKYIVAGIK